MKITVLVREKSFVVCCAAGAQKVKWLGLVGASRYGMAYESAHTFIPANVCTLDGAKLDLAATVAETLADGEQVRVLLRGDPGADKGVDELGWNEEEPVAYHAEPSSDETMKEKAYLGESYGWAWENGIWIYKGKGLPPDFFQREGTASVAGVSAGGIVAELDTEPITYSDDYEDLWKRMRLQGMHRQEKSILKRQIWNNFEMLSGKYKEYCGTYGLPEVGQDVRMCAPEFHRFARDHKMGDARLQYGRIDLLFAQIVFESVTDPASLDRALTLAEFLELLVMCARTKYPMERLGEAFQRLLNDHVLARPVSTGDIYQRDLLMSRKLRTVYRKLHEGLHKVFEYYRAVAMEEKDAAGPHAVNAMGLHHFVKMARVRPRGGRGGGEAGGGGRSNRDAICFLLLALFLLTRPAPPLLRASERRPRRQEAEIIDPAIGIPAVREFFLQYLAKDKDPDDPRISQELVYAEFLELLGIIALKKFDPTESADKRSAKILNLVLKRLDVAAPGQKFDVQDAEHIIISQS
eukprot:tig00000403_g277.t1